MASLMDLPGPFTVFAPTSTAFDAMMEGHLQYLTSAEVRPRSIYIHSYRKSQRSTHLYVLIHPFVCDFRATSNWWSF